MECGIKGRRREGGKEKEERREKKEKKEKWEVGDKSCRGG